jgi:1-phosphofructokinase family hexose kinase
MTRVGTVSVISLNPAVDVEWRLSRVVAEEKNEIQSESRWPGGKGINVTRWLGWLGTSARVFLPVGGDTGRELLGGLKSEGIPFTAFESSKPTRVNVIVTPEEGPQFRFNATWPRWNLKESRALAAAALEASHTSTWVIISGTLAFGAPQGLYASLVKQLRGQGIRVAVDCDRQPFALAARERPELVKPNELELSEWAGKKFRTDSESIKWARHLSATTGGWVLFSRGARGATLVCDHQGYLKSAAPPTGKVRNTVGAGDASLAGCVAAMQTSQNPDDWLKMAVGTGTTLTRAAAGRMPSRQLWRQIIKQVDVSVP